MSNSLQSAALRKKPDLDRQSAEESDSRASYSTGASAKPPLKLVSNTQLHRSSYLVKRLYNTPEQNLFNFVKYNLVNDKLKAHAVEQPRLLDIGCGLQAARRHLEQLNGPVTYFGVDYEAAFSPDAVVDLNEPSSLAESIAWQPDVILLLDVLEHLHENIDALDKVLENIAQAMPKDSIVIITVPQMYRLDRFKLPHLHYPEHKVRLTQSEWRALIQRHFNIKAVQGVGYLSVLPYLPMASKHYKTDNWLGRLFMHLRSNTFEKAWLKPLDLFFSRTLGRIAPLTHWSNDILLVASAKR